MPKCYDCGFNEEERTVGIDPLTNKTVALPDIYGTCTYDLKNPKRIADPFAETNCKHYAQRRKGWSTREFHTWKERHITNRRNFWISIAAILISIVTLVFGVIIPYLTTPQDVELSFQFLPEGYSGFANTTFTVSFTLYNTGEKICFIKYARVYEILEDGSATDILPIADSVGVALNPKEIHEFQFDLFSSEKLTRQFQIWIFYEPNNYAVSPIFWANWA